MYLSVGEREEIERTSFPFTVIAEPDPFSRLLKGAFVTDAGNVVREVFLLTQKDRYLLAEDTLRPVTNTDIDLAWQSAYSSYARRKNDMLFLLPPRLEGHGNLGALRSLFFCKKSHRFFHPPCPECGVPLELCRDDTPLTRSGLQPYQSSLKRYLFCPSCTAEGKGPDFYVYELDRHDPSRLKDWRGLIGDFTSLTPSYEQTPEVPCCRCPFREECYGPERKALSRIVPFSFYPFYLLVFDAMSLGGLEFVSLLAGAPLREIETGLRARGEAGRAECLTELEHARMSETTFLFDQGERSFFEILYLKLTFLADVVRGFPREKRISDPAMNPSCDAIWVKLADQNGYLPAYWNFRTAFLDVGEYLPRCGDGEVPAAGSDVSFLGLLWFYTLLVNRKNDMKTISRLLERSIANPIRRERRLLTGEADEKEEDAFSPVNIYWDPEGREPHRNWWDSWHAAMRLGWVLVAAGSVGGDEWSEEAFLQQVNDLREKVKGMIFSVEALPPEVAQLSETNKNERTQIREALLEIHRAWIARSEEEQKTVEPPRSTESMETVILAAETSGEIATAAPEKLPGVLEETAMISAPRKKEVPTPPSSRTDDMDEIVEETVILSAADLHGYDLRGLHPEVKDGPDAETSPRAGDKSGRRKGTLDKTAEEEFLEETVILSVKPPGKKRREAR